LEVCIKRLPELVFVPYPVKIEIDPPLVLKGESPTSPAPSKRLPPAPLSPEPTDNVIDPPLPASDTPPVPIFIDPLFPELVIPDPRYRLPLNPEVAVPVLIIRCPLTPTTPEFEVLMRRAPLEEYLL